ncbi:VOC family protein [Metabacillus arenae]|uniref:VOC family protein n=1 Tax=Metabacillus arenae TaxID=2771434 RepID=A0A926NDI2_9BACI|nr:VOC family protein [Metabacillus arenae]MBD1382267.1 VOC family protein [Metabacillus arenae]
MKWHHAGIQVMDLNASEHFYSTFFGFEAEERITLLDEEIVFMKKGQIRIELIKSEEGVCGESQSIHLSWEVTSLDHWISDLIEKGLQPIEGPLTYENGVKCVFYQAAGGEWIELIERVNKSS